MNVSFTYGSAVGRKVVLRTEGEIPLCRDHGPKVEVILGTQGTKAIVFEVRCEGHLICVKPPKAEEKETTIYLIPDHISATYNEKELENPARAREVALHRQLPYLSITLE